MRKSKEDALFEKIIFEAAKVKSADLEKQAIELNKEPIPEEARARFMRELDKVYPEGGKKKRAKAAVRVPRRAIAIAIACVVLVIVLIPATSEAVRRRINELIKKVMPQYTEYQLDEEILGFDGKTYVPTYIPEGFTQIESVSTSSKHILSYRDDNNLYFDITISSASTVTQLNSEGAVIETVYIGEEYGELLTKGSWTGVIWSTETNIFTVDGELSEEEILEIARNLKEK